MKKTVAEKNVLKIDKKMIKGIIAQAEKIKAKTSPLTSNWVIVDPKTSGGKFLLKQYYKENNIACETGFAIKGVHGLYVGCDFNRKSMIEEHCKAKGKTWKECRKAGDVAIKVEIREIPKSRILRAR